MPDNDELGPVDTLAKEIFYADKGKTHSGADDELTAPITDDWPARN